MIASAAACRQVRTAELETPAAAKLWGWKPARCIVATKSGGRGATEVLAGFPGVVEVFGDGAVPKAATASDPPVGTLASNAGVDS